MLSRLATTVTMTVEPAKWINVPIVDDKQSCAKKTMLLTTATSVPMPRICPLPYESFNFPNYREPMFRHNDVSTSIR